MATHRHPLAVTGALLASVLTPFVGAGVIF